MKDFACPFKLETFRKHDKSLQHQRCVKTNNALLAPEVTPLAVCLKKCVKTFDHLEALFNILYYITKKCEAFSDFEGLLTVD
jgi:hypothetical protein